MLAWNKIKKVIYDLFIVDTGVDFLFMGSLRNEYYLIEKALTVR